MSFDKLLEELDVLAKSYGDDDSDDTKIQAAADAGNTDSDDDGVDDQDEHNEPDGDENGVDNDNDGDGVMGKSFAFTLDDGTEMEAIDGTELVKSLMNRIETNESSIHKALGSAVELISKQGAMIKSLQAEVKALAGGGRGRKAVVSIVEKPAAGDLTKSQSTEPTMTGTEFMAKALAAQAAGRLTGIDVARAESYLNKGMAVPADIMARVTQ